MTYVKPATPEEALLHFGTKGMRWGVRNRTLNKASRAKDRATQKRSDAAYNQSRNTKIDKARASLASGEAQRQYIAAKKQRKVDRQNLGTREARKNFHIAKEKHAQTIQTAHLVKSGRETTAYLLGVAGSTAINVAVASRKPGPLFM